MDTRQLVLRLGADDDGFQIDRAAMAFARPGLPVPEVLKVGEAFGGAYAISVRHHGRFLEDVDPAEGDVVGPTVVGLIQALRNSGLEDADGVNWMPHHTSKSSWHDWLLAGLVDDPRRKVSGWRAKLGK